MMKRFRSCRSEGIIKNDFIIQSFNHIIKKIILIRCNKYLIFFVRRSFVYAFQNSIKNMSIYDFGCFCIFISAPIMNCNYMIAFEMIIVKVSIPLMKIGLQMDILF